MTIVCGLDMQGVKSTWRQAAPIVRTTLEGALHTVLMQVAGCADCSTTQF